MALDALPAKQVAEKLFKLRDDTRQHFAAIAQRHEVSMGEMFGHARHGGACAARAEAYRLLRARGWSSPRIGALFGRNHATVLYWLDPSYRTAKRAAAIESSARRYREARS